MSVKSIITASALLFSISASAAPFAGNDPAYAEALKQYSKEMLAAKYAEKWCSDYGVSFNAAFFDHVPPNLWDVKRYDEFVERNMIIMREKMDAERAALGREAFCLQFIDFVKQVYAVRKPVIVKK